MQSAPLPATTDTKPAAKVRDGRPTGRLKAALDLMAWENLTDSEAAVKAKLHVLTIRIGLRRPAVRAYFREQCEVLREREGPRNIHTLIEVRDQQSNQMARVQAVKALEQMSEEAAARPTSTHVPGMLIVINTGSAQIPDQRVIDANPLTQHRIVTNED